MIVFLIKCEENAYQNGYLSEFGALFPGYFLKNSFHDIHTLFYPGFYRSNSTSLFCGAPERFLFFFWGSFFTLKL